MNDQAQLVTKDDFLALLKERLQAMLPPTVMRQPDAFPGCQPVSLAREHLRFLIDLPYLVCEKSDGIRQLLLFTNTNDYEPSLEGDAPEDFVALSIDRKWQVHALGGWRVAHLHGENPSDTDGTNGKAAWCPPGDVLLDGELVDDGHTFWLFDLLVYAGQDVTGLRLDQRLQLVQNHVLPALKKSPQSPLTVRLKLFYKPYGIQELLDKIIPGQAHANDGLIFTPINEAYQGGTWPHLLKWKPPHLNTVDFSVAEDGSTLLLAESQRDESGRERRVLEPFGQLLPEQRAALALSECIVECQLADESKGTWRLVRVRTDKSIPNDVHVARRILKSIKDSVTRDDLIALMPSIRKAYKEREQRGLVPK
jgi:mRNA guanylyltransferase